MSRESEKVALPFDEELLSGYLDGSLSQRDHQRVRLFLEEDAASRQVYRELRAMRDAARTTHFSTVEETQWPELPQTKLSRFGRWFGFLLLGGWVLLVSFLAMRFVLQNATWLDALLYGGVPGGLAALFASVLIDRWRELRSDRYRGVHR